MVEVPAYLTDQTEAAIKERVLARIPTGVDIAEGSFLNDAVSPIVAELAQAAIWCQATLARGFIGSTGGAYLDLRGEEWGVFRKAAAAAKGQVTFTAPAGTVIPAGTRVSTSSPDPADPPREFLTDASVTVPTGQTAVTANVTAFWTGADGNVGVGAINVLVTQVAGVTAVTNPIETTGGLDMEADEDFRARILDRARNPASSGSASDYRRWALEVSGVGGAAVVPLRDGPGTVAIAIVDMDGDPADQALIDKVQDYIAPPQDVRVEAEALTVTNANGVTTVDRPDDVGTSKQMAHHASGPGELRDPDVDGRMVQSGIWRLGVRALVLSSASATPAFRFGIWNVTDGAWAKTTALGSVDAMRELAPSQMTGGFLDYWVDYYWDGADNLEARLLRLTGETAALVLVDVIRLRSAASKEDNAGLAPVGARVTVEAPTTVTINVVATLQYITGHDPAVVRANVAEAIENYLRSLTFQEDNDVRYARIANVILDVSGVNDYSALTVNGGTANVAVGPSQIAVAGTITLT